MPRERWISREAGFSPALIQLINSFKDTVISEEAEKVVLKGVMDNRMWNLPYLDSSFTQSDIGKVGKGIYTITEVCRLYGSSIVVVPTINFSKLMYVQNPWIDTGNYIDAIINTDLVIAEGPYPDKKESFSDWEALQGAFGRRVTQRNKPSVFLDSNFRNLPVVSQSLETQTYLKAKMEEDQDEQS